MRDHPAALRHVVLSHLESQAAHLEGPQDGGDEQEDEDGHGDRSGSEPALGSGRGGDTEDDDEQRSAPETRQ